MGLDICDQTFIIQLNGLENKRMLGDREGEFIPLFTAAVSFHSHCHRTIYLHSRQSSQVKGKEGEVLEIGIGQTTHSLAYGASARIIQSENT